MPKRTYIFTLYLVLLTAITLLTGCATYARNVDQEYVASGKVSGGSGDVHIVIPEMPNAESKQTSWVLGVVSNDSGKIIDQLTTVRPSYEIVSEAFVKELTQSGYNVIASASLEKLIEREIVITNVFIELVQTVSLITTNANSKVLISLDIWNHGELVKSLELQASISEKSATARDEVAKIVFLKALESAIKNNVPILITLLET